MAGFPSLTPADNGLTIRNARCAADCDHADQHDFSHLDTLQDVGYLRAAALELARTLDITLPDAALEGIRTHEELLELMIEELDRTQAHRPDESWEDTANLRVRITAKGAATGWYVERSLPWTPYSLDTIYEDALHAGSGSVVNITAPEGTPRGSIVRLEQRFAPLRYRGIRVRVRPETSTTQTERRSA